MAVEDAAALGILLSDLLPGHSVENRLLLWNEREKGVRKFYSGALPDMSPHGYSDPWNDFFHRYNILEEAEKALRYRYNNGRLPKGAVNFFGTPTD